MPDEIVLVKVEFGEAPRGRGSGDSQAPERSREAAEAGSDYRRSRDIHGDPPSHRAMMNKKARAKKEKDLLRRTRENIAISSGDPLALLLAGRKMASVSALSRAIPAAAIIAGAAKAVGSSGQLGGFIGTSFGSDFQAGRRGAASAANNAITDVWKEIGNIKDILGTAGAAIGLGTQPKQIDEVLRFGGNPGDETLNIVRSRREIEGEQAKLMKAMKDKQAEIIGAQFRKQLNGG